MPLSFVSLRGVKPLSTRTRNCVQPKSPQALCVCNSRLGIPNSSAASCVQTQHHQNHHRSPAGRWRWSTVIEPVKYIAKRDRAVFCSGFTDRRDALSCIRIICLWEAVRYSFEPKVRWAIQRVRTSGFEKSCVVTLSTDKGYVEAIKM